VGPSQDAKDIQWAAVRVGEIYFFDRIVVALRNLVKTRSDCGLGFAYSLYDPFLTIQKLRMGISGNYYHFIPMFIYV
jgi:hypothetical protein